MKKVISIILCLALMTVGVVAMTGCKNNVKTVDGVKVTTGTFKKSITDFSVEGIKKFGTLVVATNPNFPPFESMEGKNAVGWDIDVAIAFAKALGVNLHINTMDFDSVLASPGAGTCHIAMAGITNNAERSKSMLFTDVVFNSSQVIIVKSSETAITGPMSLEGKKVGAQRGTVGELLGKMDPDWAYYEDEPCLGTPSSCLAYDSGAMAVQALINGDVDAVIIDKYPAQAYVVANNSKVKILDESVFDDEYSFAVKLGNTDLCNELNKLLDVFAKDGTLAAINQKYFG